MKQITLLVIILLAAFSCGEKKDSPSAIAKEKLQASSKKSVGEITTVTLNDPLNQSMVDKGKAIYEMKCSACHKLKGSRIVGPSWAGLTERRKPEWIMNMITNVDVMLASDPEAQKLLEECLTRMPNQNVSIGDARDILEFIYQNDIDNKGK